MQDISQKLTQLMEDNDYSALLAFIMVENGVRVQQPEPHEKPCGGLCNTGDIPTNRETVGIRLHGHSDTGL